MTLDDDQFSNVKILCDLIYEEWNNKKEGFKLVIKSYFLALLTYLSRNYSHKVANSSPKARDIINTVSYIQENLSQKITLSNLASMACLSERQYTRSFKRIYGVAPIEYIINCRLNLACRMMKSTLKSLLEISMNCGFGDKVYFCRIFKNRYGVTPGQYRKSLE